MGYCDLSTQRVACDKDRSSGLLSLMPWPLRFLDGEKPWTNGQIGDCWYYPNWDSEELLHQKIREHFLNHQASRQYKEQWADKRPPIIIRLPSGPASPDEFYSRPENATERNGWTVTGSIEDGSLNVSPSVNIVGWFHGFIQNGQISDDVEGRTFTAV